MNMNEISNISLNGTLFHILNNVSNSLSFDYNKSYFDNFEEKRNFIRQSGKIVVISFCLHFKSKITISQNYTLISLIEPINFSKHLTSSATIILNNEFATNRQVSFNGSEVVAYLNQNDEGLIMGNITIIND